MYREADIPGALIGEIEATSIMLETVENNTSEINNDGVYWKYNLARIRENADSIIIKPGDAQSLSSGVKHIRSALEGLLRITGADSQMLQNQRSRFSKAIAGQLQQRMGEYQQNGGLVNVSEQNARETVKEVLANVTFIIKENKARKNR